MSPSELEDLLIWKGERVYISIADNSGDLRRDYPEATTKLQQLADWLGVEFEVPDYVQDMMREWAEEEY